MRSLLLLALVAAISAPTFAQTVSSALPDFDVQKKKLSASRVDTLDELRDQGAALIGKTIELRGVIKGVFGAGNSLSLMLELPDGKTQLLSATPSFGKSPAGRTGNWVRVLCRVQATVGADTLLQLVNVTVKRDPNLFEGVGDDTSAVLRLPQNVPGAPPPSDVVVPAGNVSGDGIVIGPEVMLPAPPSTGGRAPIATPRVQNRTPREKPRGNAFYGFDDSSRAAFRALAMRTNPRLNSDSADNIASSLLEAAQTHSLDPRFLAAVVQVESQFNPYAVSSAGAMGLGQLMPFNLRPLGVFDAWDPRQNLHGAAKLLRKNLNVYARDPNGTMLAVAAYHAGVGAVNRAGRAIPKATTQKYVWKVYYAYRALAPELFR